MAEFLQHMKQTEGLRMWRDRIARAPLPIIFRGNGQEAKVSSEHTEEMVSLSVAECKLLVNQVEAKGINWRDMDHAQMYVKCYTGFCWYVFTPCHGAGFLK